MPKVMVSVVELPQKRWSDLLQSALDISNDERRFHPDDAITCALERRITAGISAPAGGLKQRRH